MDTLKLYFGLPLVLNKENDILVHQPKVSEIVQLGDNSEESFNDLIFPFIINMDTIIDSLEIDEEKLADFNILDMFFIKTKDDKTIIDMMFKKDGLDSLLDGLRFFLKTDNFKVLENRRKIIIDDIYLLDNEEFEKLRKIVHAISCRKDIEIEKSPKNMTERQKDIWEKIRAGRRKKARKNIIYMQDIANYVSYCGGYHIPNKEILDMTYYELSNAYKSIVGMDSFNINLAYKLSPKYEVKDDVKHWIESLKIGKL